MSWLGITLSWLGIILSWLGIIFTSSFPLATDEIGTVMSLLVAVTTEFLTFCCSLHGSVDVEQEPCSLIWFECLLTILPCSTYTSQITLPDFCLIIPGDQVGLAGTA